RGNHRALVVIPPIPLHVEDEASPIPVELPLRLGFGIGAGGKEEARRGWVVSDVLRKTSRGVPNPPRIPRRNLRKFGRPDAVLETDEAGEVVRPMEGTGSVG